MPLAKQRISVIDNKIHVVEGGTGEIIGTSLGDREGAVIFHPKKVTFGREYTIMFQDAILELAQHKLGGNDYKVWLIVMGTSGYGTGSHLTQKEMGQMIGISAHNVNRSMTRLLKLGLVTRSDNVYYVPLRSAWRGTASKYLQTVKQAAGPS